MRFRSILLLLSITFTANPASSEVTFDRAPIDRKISELIEQSRRVSQVNRSKIYELQATNKEMELIKVENEETRRNDPDYCHEAFNLTKQLSDVVESSCQILKMQSAIRALLELKQNADAETLRFDNDYKKMTERIGVDAQTPYRLPDIEKDLRILKVGIAEQTKILKNLIKNRKEAFITAKSLLSPSCNDAYNQIIYGHVSGLIVNQCSADIIKEEVENFVIFMSTDDYSPVGKIRQVQEDYSSVRDTEKRLAKKIIASEQLAVTMAEVINARKSPRGVASEVKKSLRPNPRPDRSKQLYEGEGM